MDETFQRRFRIVNRQNVPSFAEIRQRAHEIHIERGGHICDMDSYLDEWSQAEQELREKHNKDSGE